MAVTVYVVATVYLTAGAGEIVGFFATLKSQTTFHR
jgi:hypothetical protein